MIVLQVSQFTLHGTLKGNKPDFHLSAKGEQAKPLYQRFIEKLQQSYKAEAIKGKQSVFYYTFLLYLSCSSLAAVLTKLTKSTEGVFGAMMNVNLTNDGFVHSFTSSLTEERHLSPVTLMLDSAKDAESELETNDKTTKEEENNP